MTIKPARKACRLQAIMHGIHETCMRHGSQNGRVNYNIGGFLKVAEPTASSKLDRPHSRQLIDPPRRIRPVRCPPR